MQNFASGFITIHDTYEVDENSIVQISCPNRFPNDPVKAIFAGDFDFEMVSEWENALGVLADSNVISLADNIAQKIFGVTINQPWLQRQSWKGNIPLAWKIPIKFVARTNALTDVIDPINKIMSMMVMRDANYNVGQFIKKSDGSDYKSTDSGINPSDFKAFIIPGPYPFSTDTTGDKQKGDVVAIKVGNIIKYDLCYLTNFSGKLVQQHDFTGRSLVAECMLSFRAVDNLVFGDKGTTQDFFKQSYVANTLPDKLGNNVISQVTGLLGKVG
jgi:hypothetical protein